MLHRSRSTAQSRLALSVAAFVVTLVVGLFGGTPREAWGVPVFARKYKTSCQTCHTVFPRLTPIGDAFRMNGHRFPECDASQVKEEPVLLGAEEYKQLFPADSLWPSDLPSTPPIAVVAKMRATVWEKGAEQTSHFAGLNPWADVYLAASLGENVSVMGKYQLNGPSCQNCHNWAAVNFQVIKHTTFKIGRFQPEFFNFHQQPFFEQHELFGPQRRVGANAWNYGKDVGIEAATILAGRLRAVTGVMEGQDDFNQPYRSKNGYLRLAYKLGGMRMDGAPEEGYTARSKNWQDRSLQFGALGYLGSARLQTNNEIGEQVTVDDRFYVMGGDFNFVWDDWTLYGGGFAELHGRPTGTDEDIWAERWFGGIRYVAMPAMVPSVMFDYFNTELPGDYTYQIRPRIELLIRANVKARIDAAWTRPVGESMAFRNVQVLLDVGL